MPTFDEEVLNLKRLNPSWGGRKMAKHFGVTYCKIRRILEKNTSTVSEPVEGVTLETGQTNSVLTVKSWTVRTVADALTKGEVDTAVWTVDRFVLNSWEVAAKVDGRMVTRPLWQVKIWLRRIVVAAVETASIALWARMKAEAPKIPRILYHRLSDPHLLEISPFDVHFGKLGWGRETGEDYDLAIAEKRFAETFEKLLVRAAGCMETQGSIEKILIPLGNDFLHIDTPLNQTGHGTPQDVDGRYPKLIETASMAMVRAIERCRTVAPVEVVWVPGNHDPRTSWHVAQFIWAWFRNTNGVTVDHGSKFRKYIHYGSTLLGFTHGNEEAHRDLPTIMAGEVPQLWAATRFREWHLGHFHRAKQTQYAAGDTFGPCIVRVLPSISGCDSWHFRKGYVKGTRGAEAFLYSKKDGMVASLFAAVEVGSDV